LSLLLYKINNFVAILYKLCKFNDMKFEWDESKSNANRLNHGIDFETARDLWLDESRIEIQAAHPIENRHIIIGKLQ